MQIQTRNKPSFAKISGHHHHHPYMCNHHIVPQRKLQQDENYILNRCLEYDWDNVEQHCNLLVDMFQSQCIRSSNTNKNVVPICDVRKQLTVTDQRGNTPLHAACHHQPPASTINAILNVASMTPGGPVQILSMTNSKNATPLSIACATGASPHVIHELLYPPNGLSCSDSVVAVADEKGITPIRGVMMRYEALHHHHHVPPIIDQSLYQHERDQIPDTDAPQPIREVSITSRKIIPSSFDEKTSSFHQSLATVDALIRAAWWSSTIDGGSSRRRENYISIVHGAANIAECIPPKLTDLLLHKYNTKDSVLLTTQHVNGGGILPLHLAVTADHVSYQCCVQQKDNKIHWQFLYNRKYFIDKLLQVDPTSAVSTVIIPNKNHKKRSLFCHAIELGLYWHITTDINIVITSTGSSSSSMTLEGAQNDETEVRDSLINGPLQSLWKCSPQTLYSKDPETNLYPFMLAATVQTTTTTSRSFPTTTTISNDNSIDDILQLDTIYNLLRLYPQAMKN